ncbi:metallophosphoesterase [Roseivirga spongicola]|uniref:metallophosphoesterase n=1 Tax=Roseivirga spongicola TaxID=333140 RepID=UPI002AC9160D|nr:metallophosphoesterase [Roseivirga spongicola]WPZ08754.1 metallophosphoesterase [Roseivirga spongicola]
MTQKRDYNQFKTQIEEVLNECPELKTNTSIAREMVNRGNQYSVNHLRLVLTSYFEDYPREVVEIEAEEKQPYTIKNDSYVIVTKRGKVTFPIEKVDQFFFEYSRHGKNMDSVQMINRYNLKPWEWNALKNRLLLYKSSNIFSPHTVEITPKAELEQMVESKLQTLTDNMGELVERQYSKHMLKEAKKAIESNRKIELFETLFETTERDEDQVPPVVVKTVLEPTERDHIVVTISDTHFGAKTMGSRLIKDYDRDQATEWMEEVSRQINSRKAKKVSVLLGGDYIESFTGTNHANSYQGMEYGVYGKKAYFNAVDILTSFLGSIGNVEQVIGVSGNHDRGDGRRDVDVTGEIGLMILEQLRRNFQQAFPIEYDSLLMYKIIDGIGYGLTHGHNSISKKKGEDLTFEYGNNGVYNVWVQGHLHEFRVLQNSVKVLKVVSPSIFPGNYYSEGLGFNSNPGFLEFENAGNGKAKYTLTPLD